eukprot:CAMPEP_0197077072 /NCGR_PEP_ID=MMETSP1384-20130603/212430_1 /TAXON_ID=29189 /ORGANISM="Ammonia sp." /LENGTH=831 /DNA_ID=CAMNT_0042515931 /DNA_START=118 /DNA_END=2613 /DNA_ORIENTATION=-
MQIEFHFNTESKKKSLSPSQYHDLAAMLSEFQSAFEIEKALKLTEVEFNLVNHDGSYTRLEDPSKQLVDGAIVDIQYVASKPEKEEHADDEQADYDDDSDVKQSWPSPKKAVKVESTDDGENKTQSDDNEQAAQDASYAHPDDGNHHTQLEQNDVCEEVKEDAAAQDASYAHPDDGNHHTQLEQNDVCEEVKENANTTATTSTTTTAIKLKNSLSANANANVNVNGTSSASIGKSLKSKIETAQQQQQQPASNGGGKQMNQRYVIRLRGLPWSAREVEITDLQAAQDASYAHPDDGNHHTQLEQNDVCEEVKEDANATATTSTTTAIKLKNSLSANANVNVNGTSSASIGKSLKSKIETAQQQQQQPASNGGGKQMNQRYVIRLRGLPWSAREVEITDFFCDESVIEVQIVYLTDGRASGEALVEFEDAASFQSAFTKNRHHIGHRYIEIFKSTGMEIDTAAGRAMRPPARPPKSQYVIRMRGLPYSATDEDVMEFFEVPRPSGIHLIKDDLGRPSGEGFVEFKSEVDAIAAMAKHRHHMGHRYIELFRSSPEELMRALGLTTGWYNSRNGQPQPKSTCILMRGLPYSCTESDITKFFQEIDVTPIRIHRKADGAEAYVEFYSISDTDKAMTRHRNYIGRRYIELFRVTYEDMARTVGLPVHNTNIPASIINSSLIPSTSAPTASLSKNAAMSQYSTPHGLHTLNGLNNLSSSQAPPSYHTRHHPASAAASHYAQPPSNAAPSHPHRSANSHLLLSAAANINGFNALMNPFSSIYQQQAPQTQSSQHAPPTAAANTGNSSSYPHYAAAYPPQTHHYAQAPSNPYYQQQYYQ